MGLRTYLRRVIYSPWDVSEGYSIETSLLYEIIAFVEDIMTCV